MAAARPGAIAGAPRAVRLLRRAEVLQQRARLDQVGEAEALGEGRVDRREQRARLGDAALAAQHPGEVACGAQLEQKRRLRAGDVQRAGRWCTDPAGSAQSRAGVAGRPLFCPRMPALPFKLNQDRRHCISKQKKVTNWREYDESLCRRGSLTVWFSDEAVRAWRAEPRTSRGGQPWYSPLAILTALTLRAVFRLAFRQTEGLIGSVIGLLGLDLAVPDHTTLRAYPGRHWVGPAGLFRPGGVGAACR